jgi:DNA-binding CsgD family transcriptional regulator
MRLAERNHEWETLTSLFADSVDGRGQVVSLGGPGAVGKTELLTAFTELVVGAGALLLFATASAAEHLSPFSLVDKLFRSANLAVPSGRTGLGEAVLELALERPVVIAVDDAHYVDASSMQALLDLRSRLGAGRVMLVLSQWQQPRSVRSLVHAELARSAHCTRIRLRPLSVTGVAELLTAEFGEEFASRAAAAYHAVTGGSPALVRALIEDRRLALSTRDDELVAGPCFTGTALTCLDRWEPRLLEVARGVALLGEYASAGTLAQLLEIAPSLVAPALTALNVTGLLDAGRFRHPAVRAAVLGDLMADGNSALSLKIAALLYQEGAAATEIAEHLLTGGGVRARWAVETLHDAAKQVFANKDVKRAVAFLQLAYGCCEDGRKRATITAMLAKVNGRHDSVTWLPITQWSAQEQPIELKDVLAEEPQSEAAWSAAIADIRSHVALRRGNLSDAERYARQALTELAPENWGVAVGSPLSNLLSALTAQGKVAEARELVKRELPEGIASTRYWPQFLHARGRFHLATNRLPAALADFEACGTLVQQCGLDTPAFLPWRSDLAEVRSRLGHRKAARELVTAQLELPGGTNPRVRGISLRVLATVSDRSRRPSILLEAVQLLQESGDRFELGLAIGDLSRAHHLLGDVDRARLLARRAERITKGCHAAVSGTENIARLTDAERRVAALAARGDTNRQISGKLFITISTVEQHLTRVYRKLNVNRRSDLPVEFPLTLVHDGTQVSA